MTLTVNFREHKVPTYSAYSVHINIHYTPDLRLSTLRTQINRTGIWHYNYDKVTSVYQRQHIIILGWMPGDVLPIVRLLNRSYRKTFPRFLWSLLSSSPGLLAPMLDITIVQRLSIPHCSPFHLLTAK